MRANVFTVFNLIIGGFGVATLILGDPTVLFVGVVVANSGIGIAQEVRAKRALDRLSLLVAARATVEREGVTREVAPDQVVLDDVVRLAPGDQLVADGTLLSARDLRLDGIGLDRGVQPAARGPGEDVRSGAFVVEGTGSYRVTAVGEDSFATRVTGQARTFRHPRSRFERAVNRMLYATVVLVIALGAVLGYSLHARAVSLHTAVVTSSAGIVTLIPDGLVVLVSLTYAAAAVHVAARRARAAAERDGVAGVGAHDLRGQDRERTRQSSAGSPPRARRRSCGRCARTVAMSR